MDPFALFFSLGLEHILDINGYDHILFVVALCAIYQAAEWKRILILVTAFTIGHSLTLAMATLQIINVDSSLIEFLIPVTIFITAVSNLVNRDKQSHQQNMRLNYGFALFFGFIHGMGFSNYLQALLGRDESIITQLFAFNIGLEVGQIIIVGVFMLIGLIFNRLASLSRRDWNTIVSSAVMGIAITLMIETKFW